MALELNGKTYAVQGRPRITNPANGDNRVSFELTGWDDAAHRDAYPRGNERVIVSLSGADADEVIALLYEKAKLGEVFDGAADV